MTESRRPERVVVTGPRTRAAAGPRAYVHRDAEVDEVYLRSLVRAQLRIGVLVSASVLGPLAALPMVFDAFPALATTRVLWLPLPWFLLGSAIYPILLGGAVWYVRHVERDERHFVDLVDTP